MPRATTRRLGVTNMDRGIKMVKHVATFWRQQVGSVLTAQWADKLAQYIKDLTSSQNFMSQMYV